MSVWAAVEFFGVGFGVGVGVGATIPGARDAGRFIPLWPPSTRMSYISTMLVGSQQQLERDLRLRIRGRQQPMRALTVFNKAVVDTVEAMTELGVSTVSELHDHIDANSLVEEIYSLATDLLWNDNDPDPGMDDALVIASAAQSMANVIVAEMNGAAR